MKMNWWLKLYTVPVVKGNAIHFAGPLILSTVFDWDFIAFILLMVLYFLKLSSRKVNTFKNNLNFHQNHIPLSVLRKIFRQHLLIVVSTSLIFLVLFCLSVGDFTPGEGDGFGNLEKLTFIFGASFLLTLPELVDFNRKIPLKGFSWYKQVPLTLYALSLGIISFIFLFDVLDAHLILLAGAMALITVNAFQNDEITFHLKSEKELLPFMKSITLYYSLFLGVVLSVGFGLTRNFNDSELSTADKVTILEVWPGFVDSVTVANFVELAKFYPDPSFQDLLFQKVDKSELNEMSPEFFANKYNGNLLFMYLKYAKPSSEKLAYLKDNLNINEKKWSQNVSQKNYNYLKNRINELLISNGSSTQPVPVSKGNVEGVEREIARFQEVKEE